MHEIENLQGKKVACWAAVGLLTVVAVAEVVSSGGSAAALMATEAGKMGAAALTASGIALLSDC